MRFLLVPTLMVVALVRSSFGQVSDACMRSIVQPTADRVVQMLQQAKDQSADDKDKAAQRARQFFSQRLNDSTTIWACLGVLDKKFAGILESRRIDKQVGSTSGSSGSTSLVPSGSVPALLGLAVEYGGLTQSFNGTTVTLRTTPAKLLAAMANAYGPDATPPTDASLEALQRLSLSVSFDTSRTDNASSGSGSRLLANYRQLSQATARLIIINDRDPLAPKNWRKIRKLSVSPPSQEVADQGRELMKPLTQSTAFDQALKVAMAAFDSASKSDGDANAIKKAFTDYVSTLKQLTTQIPDWQQRVDAYANARLALDQEHKKLYRQIAKAPSLTFEYDFNRPPIVSATSSSSSTPVAGSSPDLSTAGLVLVGSLLESEYTLNTTANFFTQTHSGMSGNFRDVQAAGKWDIPVGRISPSSGKGTLTASVLYEHLHQKPLGIDLTINDQKVNKPGNIGVFQLKYSIPVGDSGMQIPFSFTAANRTELIKERDLRGNVGVTFDLDKILNKK